MAEAIIFNPVDTDSLMDNDSAGMYAKSADPALFEDIFRAHYKGLHAYAFTILRDDDEAEEIVQNVFYKLWEKKGHINIETSIAGYLYKAVYNESLNFLKHTKVKDGYQAHTLHRNKQEGYETDSLIIKELREKIDKSLNELPEQCRTIFQMSRFEGMKYREIAERLGLSVKTVENQMGKALKVMRSKLLEYLPVIAFLYIQVQNLKR